MLKAHGMPGRQHGIAAITAVLVVALATILAVNLAWELNLDIRRTEVLLQHTQARQFALGAEMIAANALQTDFENDLEDEEECDYPGEDWDTELALPFEGGSVRGRLTDMQGRFNLNNLMLKNGQPNEEAYEQFSRLLEILDLDQDIAAKVLDWIDPDQIPELGGAEDGVYTSKIPPYRTANTWFTTTTELLAIDGVLDPDDPGSAVFETLERYVAALPPGQKINVNTAEDPVLLSLSMNPGSTDVESLKANRHYCEIGNITQDDRSGFAADAQDIVKDDFFTKELLAVQSNYFQLKVLVTLGTAQLTMYSLLHRDDNGVVTTSLRYFDTK
jgi:general secretion pathway protein K